MQELVELCRYEFDGHESRQDEAGEQQQVPMTQLRQLEAEEQL